MLLVVVAAAGGRLRPMLLQASLVAEVAVATMKVVVARIPIRHSCTATSGRSFRRRI
jgi:hypothetical protein